MDEYKEYLYQRDPEKYANIDAGDLTKQKAIRDKLQCKPFKWFMEEIAFDLPKKYPPVEPPDFAWGTIRSISHPNLCADTLSHGNNQPVGLYACAENHRQPQLNQFFVLSWHKDVRVKSSTKCWDVSQNGPNAPVVFYDCHGQQGNQLWRYNSVRIAPTCLTHNVHCIFKTSIFLLQKKNWLMHGKNLRCLDFNPDSEQLFVNPCDSSNVNMQWTFGALNKTALANFDTNGASVN